jgi:arginase
VWLDAHGDFNTLQLSSSGLLDGRGCDGGRAVLAGGDLNHRRLYPLAERGVLFIGAAAWTRRQDEALRRSAVTWLTSARARDHRAVTAALAAFARKADAVHIHVDLDVYDLSTAQADSCAAPDALLASEVQRIVAQTAPGPDDSGLADLPADRGPIFRPNESGGSLSPNFAASAAADVGR